MPPEEFYAGLPLAEQLRKFADFHSEPRTRHLSLYEHQLIQRASDRLSRSPSTAIARAEWQTVWDEVLQVYETSIVSPETALSIAVVSVPARPWLSSESLYLQLLGGHPPSDRTPHRTKGGRAVRPSPIGDVRQAMTALSATAIGSHENAPELFDRLRDKTLTEQNVVGSSEFRPLVNRALYLPTVAVEQSPPTFASLQELLAQPPVADVVTNVVGIGAGDPVAVIRTAIALIIIGAATGAAAGAKAGFKESVYRLTRRLGADKVPEKRAARRERRES